MANSRKQSTTVAILFSVNTCIGYAFIIGISSFYNAVGNWFLLFLPLCGFIAFIVGICFSKLTLQIQGYGGSYLYVKKAFGRYAATITGFFQYAQVPAICIGIIAGILWSLEGAFGKDWYETYKDWLVLGTFLLYLIFSFVIFFGIKLTKYTITILWILKWSVLLFSLIISLLLLNNFVHSFQNPTQNHGEHPKGHYNFGNFSTINFSKVIDAIILFFFGFGGFENLAAISHDVKNPSKVMPKIIASLILFATVFYLIYFIAMVGSLGSGNGTTINNENSANIINNLIHKVFSEKYKLAEGIVTGIIITAIVSQMANKLSGKVQSGWINTRLLAPLAYDGLIPYYFAKRDKHGQFRSSLWLDFGVSTTAVVIYCIVLIFNEDYSKFLDRALEVYTLTAFSQYILTLMAAIRLANKNEIVLSKFWKITFAVMTAFLLFLTFYFLGHSIIMAFQAPNDDNDHFPEQSLLAFFSYILVFLIANFFYFYSKKTNWKEMARKEISLESFLDEEQKLEHKLVELE